MTNDEHLHLIEQIEMICYLLSRALLDVKKQRLCRHLSSSSSSSSTAPDQVLTTPIVVVREQLSPPQQSSSILALEVNR